MRNKLFTILIIFMLITGLQLFCYANGTADKVNIEKLNNIQRQKAQTHAKIKKLRFLENIETNKLYKNQRKLQNTQTSLIKSEAQYKMKQNQLTVMENNLAAAQNEFAHLDVELKIRIRKIYKSQRSAFLEKILASSDINSMIDQIHFQGIIIKEDYKRMQRVRAKARQIVCLRRQVEQQKDSIRQTIKDINSQQIQIKNNIAQNEDMINKLQTNRAYYERSERELARQSASIQAMISHLRPSSSSNVKVTTGFIKPIAGPITSPFGYRIHPIFKSRIFHSGIDIGGANGGAIHASNTGTVIYAGWYGGYGQVVILDHGVVRGQPITTLYAHLSSISVHKGQVVQKGATIGREGSTGYSTGPHCHFEVRVNGQPRNPLNYI